MFGGPGAAPVGDTSQDYTKVEGDKTEPAPMMPPDIEMSEQQERRFAEYLRQELSLCAGERWEHTAKFARLQEKYKAPRADGPKNWPIANASQLTVPIIKTAVNTTSTRLYQTAMAAEPLASYRTEDQAFQDFAFDMERFMAIYMEEKLDMPELLDGWITEISMLGTGILEASTVLQRRANGEWDEGLGEYRMRTEDVHAGPISYHIPVEDFWIRPAYTDLQKAPWCGKEIRPTWSEVKDMALSGTLDPKKIDKCWRYLGGVDGAEVPDTVKKNEELEKFRPTNRDIITLHELCVRWDVNGDGVDEEVMVYFHHPSSTILRKKFSGFKKRPWQVARFIKLPHCFYGEGLAEMLEALQEEISTQHNQRIDNATIANLRIILVQRLIQGLKPGDRLYTGKIVKVNNVRDDVGTLQIGDVYPSTVMNENISRGYVAEVSGVSPVATGQARPISRATASAELGMMEEVNRRFDKTMKSIRRALRAHSNALNDLFIGSGTGGLAEEWLGSVRGQRLEMFLAYPADVLRRKIKVQVKATSATMNKEVEFQSQIAVFQLIIQMWGLIRNEAAQLSPQLIPVLSHEILKAITPVFKKIMQYADAPDPDAAVSVLTVLQRILPSPEDFGGMGESRENQAQAGIEQLLGALRGDGGRAGAAPAPPGVAGMADVPDTVGRPSRTGNGVSTVGGNGR